MKLWKIALLLVLFTTILFAIEPVYLSEKDGTIVDPGQLHTPRNEWVVLDTTSAADTEPSDLTDIERTYQTVVAVIATDVATPTNGDEEISIFDVPRNWNRARFRCRGTTEEQNIIHYLYFGTLGDGNRHADSTSEDCELAYAGKLDWTTGDQTTVDSTYDEMADTLTVTAGEWNKSWLSQSPTGDRVAEAMIDLMNADIIVIVTQTAGCDCQLIGTGF